MPATIIDGKAVAAKWHTETAQRAAALAAKGTTPCLAVILVGDNPASISYVTAKERACAADGIASRPIRLPATASQEDLLREIRALAAAPTAFSSSSRSRATSTKRLSSMRSRPKRTWTASPT